MKAIRGNRDSSSSLGLLAAFLFVLGILQSSPTKCRGEERVDFEKQILPIFEGKCFECHRGGGKKKPKAGLRLDVADAIIKGTKREKIIQPHRPDKSILIEVVSLPADDEDRMPPPGKARKPLTGEEVTLLRRWISEGAGFSGWLSVVQGKNPPPPKSEGVVRERIPRVSDLYPKLVPAKKLKAAVAQVDSLIDKKLEAEGIKPFPIISDEVFLRRIYLDIAGRIPTSAEAEAFLDDRRRGRRSRLIDKLLGSEAFVSHFYNFWADIFRVRFNGRTVAMVEAFARWIKSSVRENKPYDKFVHEMLSATGNALDNPAVGYWYRDLNMKVDSLAYTTQIFLGTQMDCAMCHDHPFDQWSQYDFFQLAAYIWDNKMQGYIPGWVSKKAFLENSLRLRRSTKTEVDGKVVVTWSDVPANKKNADRKRAQLKARYSDLAMEEIRRTDRTSYDTGIYQNYVRMWARERRDIVKARTEEGLYDSRSEASLDSSAAKMMEEVNYLLGYSLRRGEKAWSILPDTYRYGNARPKDKVLPKTPFGDSLKIGEDDAPFQVIANWFTAKSNPMFTRVIANRLFEYVFGQGLYRVRDDIKATDEVSNPELMALLEKRMLTDRFDMKEFLRVLYNTRAYQRQAWAPAPSDKDKSKPGWPYHYPGPLLKRMSAEQLWDSLMAMIVPEVDLRKRFFRYSDKKRFKDVDKLPPAELYEFCKDIIREESIAGEGLKKDRGEKVKGGKYSSSKAGAFEDSELHAGYSQNLARASELYQPMRAGHFLRAFGQSDREQIENSNRLSNVPQNLTLMNGFVGRYLLSESYFGKKGRGSRRGAVLWNSLLAEEDNKKRIELLYLGVLARRPRSDELAEIISVVDPADKKGLADVFWALINTEEFRFVQ